MLQSLARAFCAILEESDRDKPSLGHFSGG